ncbi:hypothetical protein PXD56_07380 [Maribacter sp. SA7]|uniref:hypothetical protein n=1 Tax=Maribacter zhoushanensis TaxID=3030012 RepID=UPI0023EB9D25|nr:hypothetical protein [Maribacter zhoushanensis]MDF4202770.1 hypothetical protein [Maribacter zhoushanensis]
MMKLGIIRPIEINRVEYNSKGSPSKYSGIKELKCLAEYVIIKSPVPTDNKTNRSTVEISIYNSFNLNSVRVVLYNIPKKGIAAMAI